MKRKQDLNHDQRTPRDFLGIARALPEDQTYTVLDQVMLGHQAASFFARREWKATGHTSGPLFGEWLDEGRALYLSFAAPGGYSPAVDYPQGGFTRNQDYVLGWLAALQTSHSSKIVWAGEWLVFTKLNDDLDAVIKAALSNRLMSQNRAIVLVIDALVGLEFLTFSLTEEGDVRCMQLNTEELKITEWKRQIVRESKR